MATKVHWGWVIAGAVAGYFIAKKF